MLDSSVADMLILQKSKDYKDGFLKKANKVKPLEKRRQTGGKRAVLSDSDEQDGDRNEPRSKIHLDLSDDESVAVSKPG